MNDYRITTGTNGSITITAIDEHDARRIYKADHKGVDTHTINVELIRENVPATKDQERKALEKIKAIVATLGPRSYVGTALDGCLEDADTNIENDFAFSMKARWESADRQVEELTKQIAGVREELAEARREAQTAAQDADFLRDKVLDSDDLTDVAQLVEDRIAKLAETCANAANRIVETATEPESAAFKGAVNDHRIAKSSLEYYQALAQRIQHARGQ